MKEDVDLREDQTERKEQQPHEPERPIGEKDERRIAEQDEQLTDASQASLFETDRATELRTRWSDVQSRFVDEPREAVKAADALVDEVIRDLSALFATERSGLETQWGRDEKVSTEDLRVALRRYRSFFERLLTM